MPLINGFCVPPVCLRRTLNQGKAKLIYTATVGGVAKPAIDVSAKFPDMLKKGLNQLRDAATIDCDGCHCFKLKEWNPPLAMAIPPYAVETSTDTDLNGVVNVYTYEVTGAVYDVKSIGICYPPGTKVQVEGKWVPVEGKKGKAEKKKKPKKKRVNKRGRARGKTRPLRRV